MKINSFYENRYRKSLSIGKSTNLSIWQYFTYKDISNELNSKSDLKILEIGVGPYGMIFKLKKEFSKNEYIGIDLDKNVLDYLNNNDFKGFSADISSEKLNIDDNSINIVIFNEVIEHIFDCQHSVNEIYRILKKGGKLYISTHNSFNIFMRLKFLLGKIPTTSLDVTSNTMGEHIRLFNKKILFKILTSSGFNNDNIINRSWFKLGKISFYTSILTSLFSLHLYFICKK